MGFSAIPPPSKSDAETSVVDAVGERGSWDEIEKGHRAHRELSVIEESSSPAKALRSQQEEDEPANDGEEEPAEEEPSSDAHLGTSPPDSVSTAT